MSDIWPIKFDAKNYSFRRNRDGIAWGVIVHPSADCIAVLAAMEPGFDIQITIEPMTAGSATSQEGRISPMSPAIPTVGQKRRELTEGERAVQRAAMLVGDGNFQEWVAHHPLRWKGEDATSFLRRRCEVASRREFSTDPDALRRFLAFEGQYLANMGRKG